MPRLREIHLAFRRKPHGRLGRRPRQSRFVNDSLGRSIGRRPVGVVILKEAASLIERDGEPFIQNLHPQVRFHLIGQPAIHLGRGRRGLFRKELVGPEHKRGNCQ